jgi:hypothetical protein
MSTSALLEVRRVGHCLQVKALDPTSLVEISFQAPAASPADQLRKLALQKLARAIGRANGF